MKEQGPGPLPPIPEESWKTALGERDVREGHLALGDRYTYVGFWKRFWASWIDSTLVWLISMPFSIAVYGTVFNYRQEVTGSLGELLFTLVFSFPVPGIGTVLFWRYKGATPGKMVFAARVVDAKTGGTPTWGQLIGRYLAMFLSAIALGLGFVWIGIDDRKQGWHDKLAGTVVIRESNAASKP